MTCTIKIKWYKRLDFIFYLAKDYNLRKVVNILMKIYEKIISEKMGKSKPIPMKHIVLPLASRKTLTK